MTKRFAIAVVPAILLLVACDGSDTQKAKFASPSQAETDAVIKFAIERHSALLAAKYHLDKKLVESITSDFKHSQLIAAYSFSSPTPRFESMQQTLDRLSKTYGVPVDVVASVIFDDLMLDEALGER